MKRFFSIFLLFFGVVVNAQEAAVQVDAGFKPTKGDFATELNFNPFKGNLSLNNAINQIKGRYFIDKNLALRLGVGIDVIDSTANYGNPYGGQSSYNSSNRKSTGIDISFGVEKHFKGTSRLSPYVGMELTYGTKSASQHLSTTPYEMDVENGWIEVVYIPNNMGSFYNTTQIVSKAFNRYGVFAIAGFDFYMAKRIYVGYEFNLGYFKTILKSPEIAVTGQNPGYASFMSDGKSSTFKSSLTNGLRVGFAF